MSKTLQASHDAYSVGFEKSRPKETLSELLSEDPDGVANTNQVVFLTEFLRQAAQLRRGGTISEEIFAQLVDKISRWVRPALHRIRATLGGVSEGRFGREAMDHLNKIEAELDHMHTESRSKAR